MLPLLRVVSAAGVFGVFFFSSQLAFAGNPFGGCSEATYAAACNHDGTSSCSGVCLPDFSQTGAPMRCLAADATALEGLGIPSLDGAGCSPAGASGSDCTHRCVSGQCVGTNAALGAECMLPDGGANLYGEVNICNSACDGKGSCAAVQHGGDKYGRGQLDYCTYIACNPLAANVAGGHEFPSPVGLSCGDGLDCMTGETCNASGECVGGTPVPDCGGGDDAGSLDEEDGGLVDGSTQTGGKPHGADAGLDASDKADGGPPADSSAGGCSVTRVSERRSGMVLAGLLLLAAAAGRRRRGSEKRQS